MKRLAMLLLLLALVPGAAGAAEGGHEGEAAPIGEILPLWSVLPFMGILLSIALFPLLAPHFWHRHYPKVSAAWAVAFGLPFLMAVKPSERTELSAVYSTDRDVSGVLSPAVARLVLAVAPLVTVFAVGGLSLVACGWLALKLHPRLGKCWLVEA